MKNLLALLITAPLLIFAQQPAPSPQCQETITTITSLLSDQTSQMSFLQALDAWGKPSGILRGTFTAMGDFNECLDVSIKDVAFNYVQLDGALKVGNFTLGSNLGVCVPEHCQSIQDLQILIGMAGDYISRGTNPSDNLAFDPLVNVLRSRLATFAMDDFIKDDTDMPFKYTIIQAHPYFVKPMDAGAIVVISLIVLLLTLVVVSSFMDYMDIAGTFKSHDFVEYERIADKEDFDTAVPKEVLVVTTQKQSKFRNLLACFSMYSSMTVLFSTKRSASMKGLAVLDVLRVISMWWVVIGHTCSQLGTQIPYLMQALKGWDLIFLENSFIAVDTFFFLSAFIVSYMMLSKVEMIRKFSYVKYALMRYLRMTPSYMVVMLFHFFLFPHLGRGTKWTLTATAAQENFDKCIKYWWTHLLYINNIYPARMGDQCMIWTWYLAADYQFYLIAPLFILLLGTPRWRKVGVYVAAASISLQSVWTVTLSYTSEIPAVASIQGGDVDLDTILEAHSRWSTVFYMQFYNHLNVFLGGVLTAYACVRYKDWKMNQSVVWSFHLLAASCLLLTEYLPYDFIHDGSHWSNLSNAYFNYFSRVLWAIGLAAITLPSVICGSTRVRLLNALFQWGGWRILARLTYGVYLVHCVIINLFHGSWMREVPFTGLNATVVVAGVAFWSYIASAVLFITVEAPVANIVKLLTGLKVQK